MVNMEKSELDPKQVFDFVGCQFNLRKGKVRCHFKTLADPNRKDPRIAGRTDPHRTANRHRKASPLGTATYEAHTVAPRKQLEDARIIRKGDHNPKVIPSPSKVVSGSNVLPGQPLHPLKHALQIFTDKSKEGWGAHISERTASGTLSLPESKHKLPETKGGLFGPKRVPRPLQEQRSS